MKSLLFDANALLYWVYPASPFRDDVSQLLQEAFQSDASCYALSSSLNEDLLCAPFSLHERRGCARVNP